MNFLVFIIFGLIAGAIAKLLMPGDQKGGCLLTSILGMIGAVVGGWIGITLGFGTVENFDLRSMGIAVLGSFVILLLFRVLFGRK